MMMMCTPLYRCPVCLHSSFSSVTALWQGLMSGASRRLTCPVCQEVLLGLDKLTLHLYSHLPDAGASCVTTSCQTTRQQNDKDDDTNILHHSRENEIITNEIHEMEISKDDINMGCRSDNTNNIKKLEVFNSQHKLEQKENQNGVFNVKSNNEVEVCCKNIKPVDENKISCNYNQYLTPSQQQAVYTASFNTNEQQQSSPAPSLVGDCSASASTITSSNKVAAFSLSLGSSDQQMCQSTDEEMCTIASESELHNACNERVTDTSTSLQSAEKNVTTFPQVPACPQNATLWNG